MKLDAAAIETPAPRARAWTLAAIATMIFGVTLSACATTSGPPPPATPGAKYEVTGDNPNYDSGCGQGNPTGKLIRGTRFKLVSAEGDCWLVAFDDQTETYIHPERVKAAK